MAQPKFLLQPLTVAILAASNTAMVWANAEVQPQSQTAQVILAPIVVTAQQPNQNNGLVVQADPKKPIQPVPATDGADYLQSIMGFNAIKNGGTNGDVTFRGMFGSRIKMLVDGSENLGACPSRMDAPTSYIQPESFDKITVIKGPQTVRYATPGSAATVIFERQPESLSKDQPYRGQASVVTGSYGRLDHNVEAAIGDETKYARLNANRSVADNYKDGDDQTVHSNWERWNADLALGWKPTQDSWLELRAGKGDGEAAYAGRSMDGSQFKRESLGLHAEQKNLNEVIKKIEAQVDYSYNDHIMDNFSLRTPPMTTMKMHGMDMTIPNKMSMRVDRRTLNTRFAVTTDWDKFSVISGVDTQHNKHGGDMVMYAMPSMNSPYAEDLKFQSYGGFSEWTYNVDSDQKLVAGARIDQVKIDNLKNGKDRRDTLASGFIRIEKAVPEHGVKTYAGLGYVERSPDFWELYSTSTNRGIGATDMMGKTTYRMLDNLNNLKNERTAQLDVGFQTEHGAWNTWASAYAGLIKDFILLEYNTPAKRQPLARNVDATIAGAEAGVGYQFNDQIQADVSTMYAWGKNTSDDRALPQIAPLEGRINLRYVEDKYSLGLLWRVVAKQNRISLNEGNVVGYDMNESKAFNTLAVNGSYQLTKAMDVSVGIDNLLDKTYTEHLNKAGASMFGYGASEQFNNIGRNYWMRMSMKF
ncbi:TonB-dependent receptor [Acinetobacter haemolyticus CIP 64.3 = MTCC 9819]|uniref:TonB-dependent copper receptor n=1 Tax=Acinetobacter haemolyticus CIP 64.3 = MTCC 9819 TaxID=1217659 RepID=N9GPF5_ACIHA|nr:TonB-dependent copper receptor [Acinetobacter haemolyticus]ENW21385.1 TonB-dependent copper receptor [Acinetobacter haemolyticus CIP 64.3 = MTCC 9819]EPR89885.1 TonB-dependent receptor [Acinetobacter haemolyticus CIP 64.3 = MTCC 9819]QXZ27375.1 TonB-dependent copper receptor [Acinetobacter haemolyticus]SPT48778.1 outer membrane copper receptor (OprC) [Acinetobacter haemolyticus]SUU66526.1 outer membrane copper receptor (OprC) [Acinetobacter haemolyticus]